MVQKGMEERKLHRFLIVVEEAGTNYSAYSPDLPGCVATGDTREEVERDMHEAVEFHIAGMKEDGLEVPEGRSSAEYLLVG